MLAEDEESEGMLVLITSKQSFDTNKNLFTFLFVTSKFRVILIGFSNVHINKNV